MVRSFQCSLRNTAALKLRIVRIGRCTREAWKCLITEHCELSGAGLKTNAPVPVAGFRGSALSGWGFLFLMPLDSRSRIIFHIACRLQSRPRPTLVRSLTARAGVLPNFESTETAYAAKSNAELFRAWLVFKACSWRSLVDNSTYLVDLSYSVSIYIISDAWA